MKSIKESIGKRLEDIELNSEWSGFCFRKNASALPATTRPFFYPLLPCQFLNAVALYPCGSGLDNPPVTCYDMETVLK